jgi:hypothetical protein
MPSVDAPAAPKAAQTTPIDLKAAHKVSQPFHEVSAPIQHTLDSAAFPHLPPNATFPGIYSPSTTSESLEGAVELVKQWAESGELKKQLTGHGGALVLRSLPLPSADAFSQVAFATKVGTQPHVEVGRPPKRTVCSLANLPFLPFSPVSLTQVLAPAVSTANEGAKGRLALSTRV